jgi:hypothetical protein
VVGGRGRSEQGRPPAFSLTSIFLAFLLFNSIDCIPDKDALLAVSFFHRSGKPRLAEIVGSCREAFYGSLSSFVFREGARSV